MGDPAARIFQALRLPENTGYEREMSDDNAEPLTIRIDRHLDMPTASEVAERVRVAARECQVVIEFGPRVECELVALATLAKVIGERSSPVLVRGLSGHYRRILAYLGVSFPTSSEPEPIE